MSETGEKDKQGETVAVEKDEREIQTLSQEEIKMKNKRIKQISQLQRKLKTMKTMMTKNMNKLETAITSFQKVESEGGSATRIKIKAEEIVELRDKLKGEKKEMDSISSRLKGVMCESEPDELGNTQEQAIEKLDDDIENYLERYNKILQDNDDAAATAMERSIQAMASVCGIYNSITANPIL